MKPPTSSTAVVTELQALRERIVGVTDSIIATTDGLLVASDSGSADQESLAALCAAGMALGTRTAAHVGLGGLRDSVIRAAGGHVVFAAIGEHALLAVVGDAGLDLATLRRDLPGAVELFGKLLAGDA
ncbi:roadblock/LC7 domain-containing protein [Catenulispora rubra]|uniref:roadblock/LC7 domain-containing protein n=1 Tax=Catenulispora rubra TaxID=280293 RepID=UPI0018923F54|nr:roadblock/LC7 domain-containing protein [Catenulispora rubra]